MDDDAWTWIQLIAVCLNASSLAPELFVLLKNTSLPSQELSVDGSAESSLPRPDDDQPSS